MYLLAWITIGLVTSWLTRKALAERGYGPNVDNAIGTAAAIGSGLIMRLASPPAHSGLAYTGPAACLGAAVLTGISILIIGRRRLA
jgi:uncharacterized membrane protein YeaQ/YmgE (transglycosylase-associated protein family)